MGHKGRNNHGANVRRYDAWSREIKTRPGFFIVRKSNRYPVIRLIAENLTKISKKRYSK